MNLKSTTANGLNFRIINSLMEFWGVRLTWLDSSISEFMIYLWLKAVRLQYIKLGKLHCFVKTSLENVCCSSFFILGYF